MQKDLDFITEISRQTGQLLMDHFDLHGTASQRKSDKTLVTDADLAAETLILDAIREAYPDDSLLSEETQPAPDLSKPAVWVIDPLDGTTNFSLGLPVWGVSIARVVQGQPETAALYFPALNEHYTAQLGQGAWLNGAPIHTKPYDKNDRSTFFCCCSRTHRRYQVSVPYKVRIMGAAAYTFSTVARGAALVGFQATPKIWDLAAGWLIVREAGGSVQVLEGPQPFPLQNGVDYPSKPFPTLMAATQNEFQKAKKQLIPRNN